MNVLLVSLQRDLDVIGLKYLHYCLIKNGYNSFFLHLPKLSLKKKSLEQIKRFVLKVNPKFIGISLMSVEYYNACDLTQYLKDKFRSIPIIWGGIHPTIAPEMCLNYADYVCIGEAERVILDFAKAIDKNKTVKTINNICYLENGKVKRNRLYPFIKNLDRIPICDYIPINSFIEKKNGAIVPIDKHIFKKNARYRGTVYSIMSSRGCPFSCTYCCNNIISNMYKTRKIRRRSIKNIISELERAIKNNNDLEYINFQDDCFLACSDQYIMKFCEVYRKKIRKPFICRSIPVYITRDKIKYLKSAGLAWINLGLQSGSDRVCENIYKRKSLKSDFLKAARIVKEFNIAAFYDILLDNPFETITDRLETIQTLIETPKPFYLQLFSLVFYFGTELYNLLKKEDLKQIKSYLGKNYFIYYRDPINNMTRISAFLNKRIMNKIVKSYKQNPKAIKFKFALLVWNLLSSVLFEPLAYFRVIKLSQRGSYLRTLRILPNYFREGLMRYQAQFKQ